MWAARCPLEERVYSRRRAVAATACLCGAESPSPVFVVARFWVSSFERERERRRHFSSVGRSLRSCVRKVVCVYEHTNMVVTTTTT